MAANNDRRSRGVVRVAASAVAAFALGATLLVGAAPSGATSGGAVPDPTTVTPRSDKPRSDKPRADKPLAGVTIALDPGHQLGNSNPAFRQQMSQTRFNGTIVKGCNTTGTATNSGYPESTFVWRVSRYTKNRLKRIGAKVRMTRTANSYDRWGPCVWDRGLFAEKVGADVLLSVHADGAPPAGRGFFVIVPGLVPGWTDDIAAKSQRYGRRMIEGMAAAGATRSTYISGQMLIWNDVSTLNFSDVPAVLVEVGNMRNSSEAAFMVTRAGQKAHADWLVAGVRAALKK
jgi:N-acetylmuramoyl-L-alanine amidase